MPNISVIVPVYNVEAYLKQCVDSVLAQTFTDFELILVDDGSTDSSAEICEQYETSDCRIKVIHKENGGLSSARNAGIEVSTGNYLLFLDADDYIEENALEIAFWAQRKHHADIVVFGGKCFPYDVDWANDSLNTRNIVYKCNPWRALLVEKGSRPFSTNKLIKSSIIKDNNLRFDEDIVFGEDNPFQFYLFPYAKRIVFIKDKLYCYRQRPNSIMERMNVDLDLKTKKHIEIVQHIISDWQKKGYIKENGYVLIEWIKPFLYMHYNDCSKKTKLLLDDYITNVYSILEAEYTPKDSSKLKKAFEILKTNGISEVIRKTFAFMKNK